PPSSHRALHIPLDRDAPPAPRCPPIAASCPVASVPLRSHAQAASPETRTPAQPPPARPCGSPRCAPVPVARCARPDPSWCSCSSCELHSHDLDRAPNPTPERLPLTKMELDLLALLVEHPGRVFSREELLNRV